MARSRPQDRESVCLAWAGWRMNVPAEWRPIRIEGTAAAGNLLLAEGADVAMQIKWWRPRGRRFDPERWMRRRLKVVKARDAEIGTPGAPHGFDPVVCVPAADRGGRPDCTLWYGYAAEAKLVLEAAVREQGRSGHQRATARLLQSLAAQKREGTVTWAVLGNSFEVPADFELCQHDLLLGDLALRFKGPGRQGLVVRQVYPADLALARRDLPTWLKWPRFKERRRYREDVPPAPWEAPSGERRLEGVIRFGRKCLRFPLGWILPRWSVSAAVHDKEAGRVLIARHDARQPVDDSLVGSVLLGMNRADGCAAKE